MVKTITAEDIKGFVDENFEKFRLKMSGTVSPGTEQLDLRIFYNQGIIDALEYVRVEMLKTK